MAEYCRRHSISPPAFYNWRQKLEAHDSKVSAFVPVTLPPAGLADEPLELQLTGGLTLRIPLSCDEGALVRVLRAAAALEAGDA